MTKMMKIAGRGSDGLAKAIKTDAQGRIESKTSGFLNYLADAHGVNVNVASGATHTLLSMQEANFPILKGRLSWSDNQTSGKVVIAFYASGSNAVSAPITIGNYSPSRFWEFEYPLGGKRFSLWVENESGETKTISHYTLAETVERTPQKRNSTRDKLDEVIDYVGAEHVKTAIDLTTFKGKSFKDVINPKMTYTGDGTLLHSDEEKNHTRFAGFAHIKQDAHFKRVAGTSNPGYSPRYAAWVPAQTLTAGLFTLKLGKVGNVPNAKLTARLYSDNNNAPSVELLKVVPQRFPMYSDGVPIIEGSKVEVTPSDFGIPAQMPVMMANQGAWLVLEYTDTTGVDANNYVYWAYGTESAEDKRGAVVGGSWVMTNGENYSYSIYRNDLWLDRDFTIIHHTFMPSSQQTGWRYLVYNPVLRMYHKPGVMVYGFNEGDGAREAEVIAEYDRWKTYAVTFSKERTKDRMKVYEDGKRPTQRSGHVTLENLRGRGGKALPHFNSPLVLGARVTDAGNIADTWQGRTGMFIIFDRELSAEEIAHVSRIINKEVR